MWLYVKTGFYSIVHKPPCSENELMVRGRCKDDMDKLKRQLKGEYEFNGEIMDSPKADYAYRIIVPRKILASFLANEAMVMDYDNFKNTIGHRDYRRRDAYMRCREAMYEWQRDLQREKKAS